MYSCPQAFGVMSAPTNQRRGNEYDDQDQASPVRGHQSPDQG